MNSVSLVIADKDEVFLNKVSKGILDRKLGYQVAIFTEMEPLLSYLEDEEVGILIIDSSLFNLELLKRLKAKVKILMIEEKNISAPGFYKVKKFQKPSSFIETINNIYVNHDKYIEDRQKVKDPDYNESKKAIVDNNIEDLKIVNENSFVTENNDSTLEDSLNLDQNEINHSNLEFVDEIDDLKILEDNMDEVLKRVNINYVEENDSEANLDKVNWVNIEDIQNKSTMPLNSEDIDIFNEIDRRNKAEEQKTGFKEENTKNDFLDDFEIWSMQEKERMEKEDKLELSKKEFDNSHSFDININNNSLNVGESFNQEVFEENFENQNDSVVDDYEDWANDEREKQELKRKLENMQKTPSSDFFEKEDSHSNEWENTLAPENIEFEKNNSDNTVEISTNNFEEELRFEEEPFVEYDFEEEHSFETPTNNVEMNFEFEEDKSNLTFEESDSLFEEDKNDLTNDLTFEEISNDFFEYENDSSNLEIENYKNDDVVSQKPLENKKFGFEDIEKLFEKEITKEYIEALKLEGNYTLEQLKVWDLYEKEVLNFKEDEEYYPASEKATDEDFKKWLNTEEDIFEEYRVEIDQDLKRKSLEYLEEIEEDYEEWDFKSKKWKEEFGSKTIDEIETLETVYKNKYDQEDFERWSIKQKTKNPDKYGGTFKSSTTISFDDDEVFEVVKKEAEVVFRLPDDELDFEEFGYEVELAGVNNEFFESPVAEVETKPDEKVRYEEWKESEENKNKNIEMEKTISKTIGFYSPAGGNGTSTIALTFATMMAKEGNNVFYLNLEKYNGTSVYLKKKKNILASDFEFILNQDSIEDLEKISILTDVDENTNISFLPVDFIENQMDENVFVFLNLIKKSNSHNYIIIDMDTSLQSEENILEQVDTEIIIISEGIVSIKKAEKYLSTKKSDYRIILNMKNNNAKSNDNLDLICEIPYMANIKDEKDLLKITNQFIIYINAIKSVLEK